MNQSDGLPASATPTYNEVWCNAYGLTGWTDYTHQYSRCWFGQRMDRVNAEHPRAPLLNQCYKFYKITFVRLTFYPAQSPVAPINVNVPTSTAYLSNSYNNTPVEQQPRLYWYYTQDPTDMYPGTAAAFMLRPNVKSRLWDAKKPFSITLRPRQCVLRTHNATQAGATSTAMVRSAYNDWIPIDDTDVMSGGIWFMFDCGSTIDVDVDRFKMGKVKVETQVKYKFPVYS